MYKQTWVSENNFAQKTPFANVINHGQVNMQAVTGRTHYHIIHYLLVVLELRLVLYIRNTYSSLVLKISVQTDPLTVACKIAVSRPTFNYWLVRNTDRP